MFKTNLGTQTSAQGGQMLMTSQAAQHLKNHVTHIGLPQYRGQTQVSGAIEGGQDYGLEVGSTDEASLTPSRRMGLKAVRYDRIADDRLGSEVFGEGTAISANA